MSSSATTSPDPRKLRPLLHAELDRLSDEHLDLAHKALREIELHQVAEELDDAADFASNSCQLTLKTITAAIAEHRALHPYR